MTTSFSIHGELTLEGLRTMRADIDALLADLDAGVPRDAAVESPPTLDQLAQRKAQQLRQGLGDKTWRLLFTAAANFPDETSFTFRDLAQLLETQPSTIRAWHRGASKVIKRADTDVGAEPTVLVDLGWDGEQKNWSIPETMRTAILAIGP
jgi:hypothetical protein